MTRIAVAQLEGRGLADAGEALEACRELVAEAAGGGADLVVLPEGSYPAYALGSADAAREVLAAGPDPRTAFGEMARRHGVVLVAGVVLDSPAGLANSALTFDRDGAVLARADKRFLWHFDRHWFVAGEQSPVVDTPAGRMGSLVCADARLPEIARAMSVAGAAMVCDPTAWVTSTPGAPSNVQPDFLVAARCIENGIVMACASKAGFEGPAVAYAGRSMVVGPRGEVLAEAPVRGDAVASADVDLAGLPRLPVARRPALYGGLAEPGSPPAVGRGSVRLGAVNALAGRDDAWVPAAAASDVVLLALPRGPDPAELARASGAWCVAAAAGTAGQAETAGEAVLVSPDGLVARFPRAHGEGARADELRPPVDTPAGQVVALSGEDAMVPEPARVAALRGAHVLAVTAPDLPLAVLRARAAENRVFVVAPGDRAVVVAPSGRVVADAPSDRPFVASADCFLDEAASKEMAPVTDVFAGRQPPTYDTLFEG